MVRSPTPKRFSALSPCQNPKLSLSPTGAELSLPMCGSGADPKKTSQKMTWTTHNMYMTFNFIDLAGDATCTDL